MDPISIEKIRAMRKYRRNRKQQQLLLPALAPYLVATCGVLCLLLTSPAWFPGVCSLLVSFLLTTLPDLATAFLLSPKCLFVVGNLIVAFLIAQSRLAPKSQPASVVDVDDVHEEHVKRNVAPTIAKAATRTTVMFSDHSASVEAVWEGEKEKEEEEEEEQGEEELEKRVDDFIARVKRQRKLEGKSFFDTDR
ncbi:hypothetical protein CFC21_043621 [Triticum aestivum]|uniref:DUF4408 domain-containing protein n=2 Tax=Triticum aestivum TaxID=4565 RepID=A0A9R1JWU6_WHEAT|nr:uncharacterized protein LOC119278205 [Triticum dicoccoides]XP_044345295.1 uncharacterized protein LOC123066239 [Triticum aestivum]KAF7032452.1 hypothetical protein CFC21_043621 [Triticum aestivum]CDM85811.1 unnamed protein product [Triticum aestivum]